MAELGGIGADIAGCGAGVDEQVVLLRLREADSDLGVDTRRRHLGLGAIGVATVGDEHQTVGQEHDDARSSR